MELSRQVCARNSAMAGNFTRYNVSDTQQAEDLLGHYTTLPLSSAAHFGLATGLLIALVINVRVPGKITKEHLRSDAQQWAEALFIRIIFGAVCFLFAVLVTPFFVVSLSLLTLYRHFAALVLRLLDPAFAGMLEGTDVVWALEDDASKSIINVLAMFEVEIVDNDFQPRLMDMLRKLMKTRILTTPDACPKFWQHRRRSRLGYFYWARQSEVRVEDHIQYMTQEDAVINQPCPESSDEAGFSEQHYGMSECVLKALVSELANSPLPGDNSASWEILVGRDPILEDVEEAVIDPFQAMEEGITSRRVRRYPVLFRIHHSMGDGVALIKLLLETLADKTEVKQPEAVVVQDGVSRTARRKSLIESVSLIPCTAGPEVESDDEVVKPPIAPVKIAVIPPPCTDDCANDNLVFTKDTVSTATAPAFVVLPPPFIDDTFRYPVNDGFVSIEDDMTTTPVSGLRSKSIYFFKEKDDYEKMERFSPPRCDSPIPPFIRCDSPMLISHDRARRHSSPVHRMIRSMTERPESPVPMIHRKNYPKLREEFPERAESPVPRIHRKNYPNLREEFPERAESPVPRIHRKNYPNLRQEFLERPESRVPRIHRKNYPHLLEDCARTMSPVPRNEYPFQRCGSPLPRNDHPIPRCNSPFQRSSSPIVVSNVSKLRSLTPQPRSETPGLTLVPTSIHDSCLRRRRSSQVDQFTEIPLTDKTEYFVKGTKTSVEEDEKASNGYVPLLDSLTHRHGALEVVSSHVKSAAAFVFAPVTLLNQTLIRAADVNPLHGKPLSGRKVLAWHVDKEEDTAFSMIKRIKSRMSEAKFTDVFLSALSASLEAYFVEAEVEELPESLSVVLPARMSSQEDVEWARRLKESKVTELTATENLPAMENRFSVALFSLPISSPLFTPIGRLRAICRETDLLRRAPDYLINYWLMRVVSAILPLPMLAPLLNSSQSTVVVSNLMGPPRSLQLGGYKLNDLVFWVPNRGSTGVGVSVLSYADRLQLGVVADEALIGCQQDANIILQGVIDELTRLDEHTAPVHA